jgi:hypothetical protein
MDITARFPDEILDMIFIHLQATDLKKAMFVNPTWNEIIGNSRRSMSKFKFVVVEGSPKFKGQLESQRKYSNIVINNGEEKIEKIQRIVEVRKSFANIKSVEIINTKFASSSQFIEFVKVFEASVAHMMFHGVMIKEVQDITSNLTFKHLKTFVVKFCDDNIFIDMIAKSTSLTAIVVGQSKVAPSNPQKFIEMLQNSSDLKQFNLNAKIFAAIFTTDISDIPFKLIELSVTNYGTKIDINATGHNFMRFLQSQSNSMRKLHLCDFFGKEIMRFAFQMKSLRELKMMHLPLISWKHMVLKSAAAIETFDIITTDIKNKDRIKALLRAVPKAKRLRLRSIDDEIATFIDQYLKDVEVIQLLNPEQRSLRSSREILPYVQVKVGSKFHA